MCKCHVAPATRKSAFPWPDCGNARTWRFWMLLLICAIWMMTACTDRQAASVATAEQDAQQRYLSIRSALHKNGTSIDYDTLIEVYREMVSSPVPIPDLNQLLGTLIEQRNADPRIDQMVLILAAHFLGNSKYPISNAEGLFQCILEQNEERISHWMLAYVADAIGNYREDLPGGDALVDRVQALQQRLDSHADDEKEYFGTHFLPPPKSPTIIDHLAGISDRRARQRERSAFYMLVMYQIPENAVVTAFKYIKTNGIPGTGEIPQYPLASLIENWHNLPVEIKQPNP